MCVSVGIDLKWADMQTWTTLFDVINERLEVMNGNKKKEKVKATPSQVASFIKKEGE